MAAPGKPIVDRLEQLTSQWSDFADKPDARVLCWLCEPDELGMVDAFVAMEDDDRAGQTQDLFVPLQAPYAPGRYGDALLREFVEQAASLYQGLDDPSVKPWQPPRVAPNT